MSKLKTTIEIHPLPFEVPVEVRYHIGDTYKTMPTSELDRETLQKLCDKWVKQTMAKAGYGAVDASKNGNGEQQCTIV